MNIHLRQLSKQTLIFGLGEAVTRVAAFILLPLYTHLLTPDDFGKLAMVSLVSTVLGIVLSSGQNSAFFRFYFQSKSAEDRRKLVSTELGYLLIFAALGLAFGELLLSYFGDRLFYDASILPLVQLGMVSTFFDTGAIIPFAMLRAEQRALAYALMSIARFILNLALNIIVVFTLGWGVWGVVLANLLTSFLFFIICIGFTIRTIEWTIDTRLLQSLLRYGLPLVPANLSGWTLNLSDRFFLERFAGVQQVGVYSVGYAIASILNMISGWFNTAYAPYVFSMAKEPDAKIVYARMMTYVMAVFTALGLCLALFSRVILAVVATPDYYAAVTVVPLIVLAYLLFESSYLLSFGLDLSGRTEYYPIVVGSGAILNLLLNAFLIPNFGMMGAAWATVFSYALLPLLNYLIVKRLYPIPYEWRRLLKLAVVTAGIYMLSLIFPATDIWVDAIIKASLIPVWILGLFSSGFITKAEFNAMRSETASRFSVIKARTRSIIAKIRNEVE